MTDTISITREEVREARKEFRKWRGVGHKSCFLGMKVTCGITDATCRLCKRLTEFAEEDDDRTDSQEG